MKKSIKSLLNKFDPSRFKRLSKEGAWIIGGQIATVIGSFFLVRALTEYLDPVDYGKLALGLTVAGFVNQLIMGGISNGITRFYSIAIEKNDLFGYISSSKVIMFYATILVIIVGVSIIFVLKIIDNKQWISISIAALFYSLFSAYNGVISGIQNSARQRKTVAIHGIMDVWLKIALAILVMLIFGKTSTSVVWGYTISIFIVTLSQLYFINKLIKSENSKRSKVNEKWIKQILDYSWPFILWGVFNWVQQSAGRWSLELYLNTEDVGYFSLLTQIGSSPIQVLVGLTMSFLMPIVFTRAGDGSDINRNKDAWKILKLFGLCILSLTLLVFLFALGFHKFIFQILVSKKYWAVSYLLPWTVLAGGASSIALIIATQMHALKKTANLAISQIGGSMVGIIATFPLVKYFGMIGAIYSSIIYSISYLILTIYIVQKNNHIK
jgi:O-antigen/teichoic acid export membrane protein